MQYYNNEPTIRQNKRKLASKDEAMLDLKTELSLMFMAFKEAYHLYEMEIAHTPPEARARGYEASLLNSKMIQCIQKHFPKNWKFGKYKRFTLRINGYIILFKKFGRDNRPMNVQTRSVDAISQQLSIPLFNDSSYVEEPILFFGYKRNSIGNISEPQLIYIDEQKIKWSINSNEVTVENMIEQPRVISPATPRLKSNILLKKKTT